MLYLLYKLIFDFIIPLYSTTKKVKRQVNDLQQRMQEQAKAQQQQERAAQTPPKPVSRPSSDDYIEYEEVK